MRILIDGHNAIGALKIKGESHEEARVLLLRRVAACAPGAVVYFAARNAPPGVISSRREQGVKVIYCRKKEADARILERVRDAAEPGGYTVVTNDREVRGKARQLGASVARVREFFGPPDEPAKEPPPRPRGHTRLKPADFGLSWTMLQKPGQKRGGTSTGCGSYGRLSMSLG